VNADKREPVDEALAARMESLSPVYDFTPVELADIERRAADPNPQFADAISKPLGKPFRF
jgi:hypothetical protein